MQAFTIPLVPEGDSKSEYRLQNEYEGQIERPDILDYGTTLNVQAELIEVVHGHLRPDDGGEPATLIITDFIFASFEHSRPFRKATITYLFQEFDSSAKDTKAPEVFKIAPQGDFSMNQTSKQQELKRGANLAATGGYGPASVTAGLEWSLTETKTKQSHASLVGIRKVVDKPRPPKNAALWSLEANPDSDKGIPSLLRTVILLKRRSNDKFRATVNVKAEVDWKYKLQMRFGKIDIAPVDFDPNRAPKPTDIESENLEHVDLKKLMAIQTTTNISTEPSEVVPTTID